MQLCLVRPRLPRDGLRTGKHRAFNPRPVVSETPVRWLITLRVHSTIRNPVSGPPLRCR